MARHAPLLFTVLAVLAVAAASASAYVRAVEKDETIIIRGAGDDDRLVGDEEDEFGLGGVIIRRRRMQDVNDTGLDGNGTSVDDGNSTGTAPAGYISYGALRANNVPCDQRGASYYNCRPGAEANPYTRGCSAITQCRG
ncbi:hypothetical protein PR202_gb21984 [Eleusine coracana subsp. coracana]|uniref:Uncharacterized protein n=1 Tax=Eleusine coracana subsp. coracana TaxID=191504 RepID=A0AAV5FEL0_ELECO|nr:hypothetical protein QOZ80_7BG0612390 [Eleusine coracana subsp. coracana]GJN33387.1 hypothetical protein PR202_gb21984 [Eleusine coracana subsp. coracana]